MTLLNIVSYSTTWNYRCRWTLLCVHSEEACRESIPWIHSSWFLSWLSATCHACAV